MRCCHIKALYGTTVQHKYFVGYNIEHYNTLTLMVGIAKGVHFSNTACISGM